MTSPDSLPLFHSWPLFDAGMRIGAEHLFAITHMESRGGEEHHAEAKAGIGIWSCDLASSALRWSRGVYALFGLPPEERLTRSLAVSLYAPRSRNSMEALREHAIHHRRGFTMDAMIRRPDGEARWMRLSAMPLLKEGKVVRLCGTKQDVTEEYVGPGWRQL